MRPRPMKPIVSCDIPLSSGLDQRFETAISRMSRPELRSKQAALGEVAHERAGPEGPGLAVGRELHAVDKPAELRRGDRDDVADLVREPLPRRLAVLDGREHRAQ